MAISLDLNNSQYGIPFQGAYFRIVTAAISRQRTNGPKFSVMIDIAGYGTNTPGDDTREIDFRRYYVDLFTIESQTGTTFLDKCYNWTMSQPDMAGSVGV
jgi:hypothetical protein